MVRISVNVDGVRHEDDVEPRLLLVHWLRDGIGKVGTPIGCDTSNCGACTVLIDGRSAKSCSLLAVQADGTEITTIQGLANGEWHPVQTAFKECHGLQCGYCTPGMVLAAVDLLSENPSPTEQEIREGPRRQPLPLYRIPEHREVGCSTPPPRWLKGRSHDGDRRAPGIHRQPDPSQGGRSPRSPARRSGPTTSPSPVSCTWPSCAAPLLTRRSRVSTSRPRCNDPES